MISDNDIIALAEAFGIEEAAARAVIEVESRGNGFDDKGRVKILFEPHIFYREIKDPKIRDQAVQRALAYRVWGTLPYEKDSYVKFNPAFYLDPIAAMRSCSWGLGQVMGFNHEAAGYDDVGQMVDAFKKSEFNQLCGMFNFIRFHGLDKHLRAKNWTAFARGYNGPAYAKNGYHTKLEKAYTKWGGGKK